MKRIIVLAAFVVVTTWAASAVADSPKLRGAYGFTGSAACMDVTSPNNFNSSFQPPSNMVTFGQSFAVEGIRKFDGSGKGTVKASSMGITFPAANEGAGSDDFEFSFTYTVHPDGSWSSDVVGLVTGTVKTGGRAGQTYTVANLPPFSGLISQDGKTLTAATLTPQVETVTYSDGTVHNRICHRSRVLIKLQGDNDDGH